MEGKNGLEEPELKIDVEMNPLRLDDLDEPNQKWERMIRSEKVRVAKTPIDQEQRERIR
jgi:hypothetical protein